MLTYFTPSCALINFCTLVMQLKISELKIRFLKVRMENGLTGIDFFPWNPVCEWEELSLGLLWWIPALLQEKHLVFVMGSEPSHVTALSIKKSLN